MPHAKIRVVPRSIHLQVPCAPVITSGRQIPTRRDLVQTVHDSGRLVADGVRRTFSQPHGKEIEVIISHAFCAEPRIRSEHRHKIIYPHIARIHPMIAVDQQRMVICAWQHTSRQADVQSGPHAVVYETHHLRRLPPQVTADVHNMIVSFHILNGPHGAIGHRHETALDDALARTTRGTCIDHLAVLRGVPHRLLLVVAVENLPLGTADVDVG